MNSFWTEHLTQLEPYIYTFIPIFVAIAIVGGIPLYTGLTSEEPKRHRRKIAMQTIVTAFILSTVFLLVGKTELKLLGITVAGFQVAGGALLFIFAMVDIVGGDKSNRSPSPARGKYQCHTKLFFLRF